MHKVFISHHHKNDQLYKEELVEFAEQNSIFVDVSVDTGDISEDLTDEQIRKIIRDEYLRDSTVTIVLVGPETMHRKHVDWEIHSSMFDGPINKKSGILVVNLPSIPNNYFQAAHGGEEKKLVYPDVASASWMKVETRNEYESRYPYMPERIIDNLLEPEARISVVPWERLDAERLRFLVDSAFQSRSSCKYDLRRRMRRDNL